jgi:hypothetical protein
MPDTDCIGPAEEAEMRDPNVGAGTPETAPSVIPFDDDADLPDVELDVYGLADAGDDDALDDEDASSPPIADDV